MFVPPSWVEGFLIQFVYLVLIPLAVAVVIGIIVKIKTEETFAGLITIPIAFVILLFIAYPIGCVYWHNTYEVPSVQEKIITVGTWEPKPGLQTNDNGMLTINSADQLLMVTKDGEGFLNEENFLFNKFNTRDIFNQLKVNGTYKIKYFGWRNGFNNGFPCILSVEQVINESNATPNNYVNFFGTRLST